MTFILRILTETSACGCWRLQVLERSQLVLLLRCLFHLTKLAGTSSRQSWSPVLLPKFISCFFHKWFSKVLWAIPCPEYILAAISLNWRVKSWSLWIHIHCLYISQHNCKKASCSWIPWCCSPFCWWVVELLSCPLSCGTPPCSRSRPSSARRTLSPLFASVTTCLLLLQLVFLQSWASGQFLGAL
jgi:hypothetical protein